MVKEAALRYNWVSPQDYLAAERVAEEKHEYFDGEVVKMQGGSLKHNRIVASILKHAGNQLEGKPCEVLPSDMRTSSPGFQSYSYPDVIIVCGEAEFSGDENDVLQNPLVIFEVVSRTSVNTDYGRKLLFYRQIPSLMEYVLINSFDKVEVDIYRRFQEAWALETYKGLEEVLRLDSIKVEIPLSEIYKNITFD